MTHELRPARPPNPASAVQARRPDPHSTSPVLMDGGPNLSIVTSQSPILTPRDTTRAIIREVAERYDVWVSDLLNTECKDEEMAFVRHEAIAAIHRAKPQMSCQQIADVMRCDRKVVWNVITGRGAASLTQDAAE